MMGLADDTRRTLTACALTLALVAAPPAARQVEAQESGPSGEQARTIQVKILGMSCPFCAYGAEQKLEELEGVEELEVELESGVATLTMEEGTDVSNEQLKETVDSAGFEAAAIVRSFESEFEDWNPEEMPDEEGSGAVSGTRSGSPACLERLPSR